MFNLSVYQNPACPAVLLLGSRDVEQASEPIHHRLPSDSFLIITNEIARRVFRSIDPSDNYPAQPQPLRAKASKHSETLSMYNVVP
ncbi:uncharacterized protein CLUP02_07803 [Colletotrichum lupini]|uniref:Uncharacterized protein n=1 Tax=Colletotrichum lupini TaxID=145971 RepID=A0A9Q8ST38_9PEZI|nr:uncharacterized protein CLUP02_07803 [Colletotrichum lupini]UQC82316.1 hypothetical protein CLUP02_07803 [Colletotrichum lupini]